MIITITSASKDALYTKTSLIQEDELPLAQEIADKLYKALTPYFPAAGLAAPQIGITKALFIYSYDRDPKNLEAVINPSFTPIGNAVHESWEGCLSTTLIEHPKIAKLCRYQTIKASYLDLNGQKVEKVLDGFSAKVFQHECDHLEGILNIDRKEAEVKTFSSQDELKVFMDEIKKQDATQYKKP